MARGYPPEAKWDALFAGGQGRSGAPGIAGVERVLAAEGCLTPTLDVSPKMGIYYPELEGVMIDSTAVDRTVLTLPIKWSILAAIIVVVLTAMFFFVSWEWEKTIIFAAAATAAAGTVLAAGYTGRTLNLFISQEMRIRGRESALDDLGKKNRAMHFAERWNDPQMYHARKIFHMLVEKRNLPQNQLIAAIDESKTNVIHIMNFLEEAAFSLEHDFVDEELTRTQFEGIVVVLWSTLEPWVKLHRIDRGRPRIWCMVEDLYIRWK